MEEEAAAAVGRLERNGGGCLLLLLLRGERPRLLSVRDAGAGVHPVPAASASSASLAANRSPLNLLFVLNNLEGVNERVRRPGVPLGEGADAVEVGLINSREFGVLLPPPPPPPPNPLRHGRKLERGVLLAAPGAGAFAAAGVEEVAALEAFMAFPTPEGGGPPPNPNPPIFARFFLKGLASRVTTNPRPQHEHGVEEDEGVLCCHWPSAVRYHPSGGACSLLLVLLLLELVGVSRSCSLRGGCCCGVLVLVLVGGGASRSCRKSLPNCCTKEFGI